VRARVPFTEADREFGRDITAAIELVRSGALVDAAESAIDAEALS
jgi:histidine ammonia-lyase